SARTPLTWNAWCGPCERPARASPRAGRPRLARATPRAASSSCATGSSGCSTPGRPSSSRRRAPPGAAATTRRPGRASRPASGGSGAGAGASPLGRAATGAEVTAEELGGGDVHTRISGVADHLAADDDDALTIAREIFQAMPPPRRHPLEREPPEEPAYDPRELHGIVSRDPRRPTDAREVIARL